MSSASASPGASSGGLSDAQAHQHGAREAFSALLADRAATHRSAASPAGCLRGKLLPASTALPGGILGDVSGRGSLSSSVKNSASQHPQLQQPQQSKGPHAPPTTTTSSSSSSSSGASCASSTSVVNDDCVSPMDLDRRPDESIKSSALTRLSSTLLPLHLDATNIHAGGRENGCSGGGKEGGDGGVGEGGRGRAGAEGKAPSGHDGDGGGGSGDGGAPADVITRSTGCGADGGSNDSNDARASIGEQVHHTHGGVSAEEINPGDAMDVVANIRDGDLVGGSEDISMRDAHAIHLGVSKGGVDSSGEAAADRIKKLEKELRQQAAEASSLRDRLETAELWSKKLEADREAERTEASKARTTWEKKVFELETNMKRETGRSKDELQRLRGSYEGRLKTVEAELRKEKTARIRGAMLQATAGGGAGVYTHSNTHAGVGGGAKRGQQDGQQKSGPSFHHAIAADAGASELLEEELPEDIHDLEEARRRIAKDQRIIRDLRENVDSTEDLFNRLVVMSNNTKEQLNEAKQMLLRAAAELPDVIASRWFCEASPEEVQKALEDAGKGHLCVTHRDFNEVLIRVDTTIRDASFDPFVRRHGQVVGVDTDHMVLRNIAADLGQQVADVIIEKKREVEKYCPSGCYPTEVLYDDEHEMELPECVDRLVSAVKILRSRLRRKRSRYTLEPGWFKQEKDGEGMTVGESAAAAAAGGRGTDPWSWADGGGGADRRAAGRLREPQPIGAELVTQFRSWILTSHPNITSQTATTQTTWALNFVRKLVAVGQRLDTMEEVRQLVQDHKDAFEREIGETRAVGVRTALRRFVRWAGMETADEDGTAMEGQDWSDGGEDEGSGGAGRASAGSYRGATSAVLDTFAKFLTTTSTMQDITMRDYVVKINQVFCTLLMRARHERTVLDSKDQICDFYRAHTNLFVRYMQALGTTSADRAKRSALRYLMRFLGVADENPIWTRQSQIHPIAPKEARSDTPREPPPQKDTSSIGASSVVNDDMEEEEEEESGVPRTLIPRDFKLLGETIRARFKQWLLDETQDKTRPLADGTAHEHCLSMNNLLRRAMMRAAIKERCMDDMKEVRAFVRANAAAFKAEAGKLTYGRVTAYRYFLRFLGVEHIVLNGIGPASDPKQLLRDSRHTPSDALASGGASSSVAASAARTPAVLPRSLRKAYKRWCKTATRTEQKKRRAKADLHAVQSVLTKVQLTAGGGQLLDVGSIVSFIEKQSDTIRSTLKKQPKGTQEAWQAFVQFVQGSRLTAVKEDPGSGDDDMELSDAGGSVKEEEEEGEFDGVKQEEGEGEEEEGDDGGSSGGSSGPNKPDQLEGMGLIQESIVKTFQRWLTRSKPVNAKTAYRYMRSFCRTVRRILDTHRRPLAEPLDASSLVKFVDSHRKALEATKAETNDKSAKAAIGYFFEFTAGGEEAMMARGAARRDRSSASAVPAAAAASAKANGSADVEVLGATRRKSFRQWAGRQRSVKKGLAKVYARLANRVLSRVWLEEAPDESDPTAIAEAPDAVLREWVCAREEVITDLLGKATNSPRPAAAIALLWEFLGCGGSWGGSGGGNGYISDSSAQGMDMCEDAAHPAPSVALGKNDDSSDEELLMKYMLQPSANGHPPPSAATTHIDTLPSISRRMVKKFTKHLQSVHAHDIGQAAQCAELCSGVVAEALLAGQGRVTTVERVGDLKAIITDSLIAEAVAENSDEATKHAFQLMAEWLTITHKSKSQDAAGDDDDDDKQDDDDSSKPPSSPSAKRTGALVTGADIVATLRSERGGMCTVSEDILTGFADWLLLEHNESVGGRKLRTDKTVATYCRCFRSVVHEVMKRKNLPVQELQTPAEARAFFDTHCDDFVVLHNDIASNKRAALRHAVDYLWEGAEDGPANPIVLAAGDAATQAAADGEALGGGGAEEEKEKGPPDQQQQQSSGCLEDSLYYALSKAQQHTRGGGGGGRGKGKQGGTEDESDEDDKQGHAEDGDDCGDSDGAVLSRGLKERFKAHLSSGNKVMGEIIMDNYIVAVGDVLRAVMGPDAKNTLRNEKKALGFVRGNQGRVTVELEECSSRAVKTAWGFFKDYLEAAEKDTAVRSAVGDDGDGGAMCPSSSDDDDDAQTLTLTSAHSGSGAAAAGGGNDGSGGRVGGTTMSAEPFVVSGLLKGYLKYLEQHVAVAPKTRRRYLNMVESSLAGVMVMLYGDLATAAARAKCLNAQDIRPFSEENMALFERVWTERRWIRRCSWEYFCDYADSTSGVHTHRHTSDDDDDSDISDSSDEDQGKGPTQNGRGQQGSGPEGGEEQEGGDGSEAGVEGADRSDRHDVGDGRDGEEQEADEEEDDNNVSAAASPAASGRRQRRPATPLEAGLSHEVLEDFKTWLAKDRNVSPVTVKSYADRLCKIVLELSEHVDQAAGMLPLNTRTHAKDFVLCAGGPWRTVTGGNRTSTSCWKHFVRYVGLEGHLGTRKRRRGVVDMLVANKKSKGEEGQQQQQQGDGDDGEDYAHAEDYHADEGESVGGGAEAADDDDDEGSHLSGMEDSDRDGDNTHDAHMQE